MFSPVFPTTSWCDSATEYAVRVAFIFLAFHFVSGAEYESNDDDDGISNRWQKNSYYFAWVRNVVWIIVNVVSMSANGSACVCSVEQECFTKSGNGFDIFCVTASAINKIGLPSAVCEICECHTTNSQDESILLLDCSGLDVCGLQLFVGILSYDTRYMPRKCKTYTNSPYAVWQSNRYYWIQLHVCLLTE